MAPMVAALRDHDLDVRLKADPLRASRADRRNPPDTLEDENVNVLLFLQPLEMRLHLLQIMVGETAVVGEDEGVAWVQDHSAGVQLHHMLLIRGAPIARSAHRYLRPSQA